MTTKEKFIEVLKLLAWCFTLPLAVAILLTWTGMEVKIDEAPLSVFAQVPALMLYLFCFEVGICALFFLGWGILSGDLFEPTPREKLKLLNSELKDVKDQNFDLRVMLRSKLDLIRCGIGSNYSGAPKENELYLEVVELLNQNNGE